MAKFRAVILIDIDMCDVLETGESSGRPMKKVLKENGLCSKTISIEAESQESCIEKVKEKLHGIYN